MAVLPVGIGPETSYNISRSLRFNSADSAYLNRTFGSGGSLTTWTWSAWVKRSTLGTDQQLFGWWEFGGAANDQHWVGFTSNDTIEYKLYNGQTNTHIGRKITSQVFRDVSSFYHLVAVWDTSNATAADRMRLYVNGVRVTAFGTSVDPSQNTNGYVNLTSPNALHTLGAVFDSSFSALPHNPFNGYLTEVHFVNGSALTPSSFGETDPITGVWKPKKYTGTYGTNGFYLNFSDNSGTTSTTLGKDYSGNGNNWTPNNFSVTAGSGNDSLVDVPTLWGSDTGAGGEVRGNYCTWNPLKTFSNSSAFTIANGNLDISTANNTSFHDVVGTMACGTSGKYYWEVTVTTDTASDIWVGIIDDASLVAGTRITTYGSYRNAGNINNIAGSAQTSGSTYTTNDVVGVAVDVTNGTVQFYKNGVAQGATPSFTFTAGTVVYPKVSSDNASGAIALTANFGQRPFAYTAPSGFKALCTTNLPEPTIKQGDDYFNAVLWTGNATERTIDVGFQPDLVWIKTRSNAASHNILDSVRGVKKLLSSNTTDAELTEADTAGVDGFVSNGFTLEDATFYEDVNQTGRTYVAWNWKANGTGVTNTAGTITSTVSANTTSGFSIVSYTGNATSGATIGHGLGVQPQMIIIKNRDDGTKRWLVYYQMEGSNKYLFLNTTDASGAAGLTAPTSTVFTVGGAGDANDSGEKHIAYCFAPVAGFSAFGSYTGNGSADGTFVYTGFRPKFVLVKTSSNAGFNWALFDTARNTSNSANLVLYPNSSGAEDAYGSGSGLDILSNGFKHRDAGGGTNGNGLTYIYAAFAEVPYKFALGR